MEVCQQSEKEVCQFLRTEERLNAELKHGHYDNFFDSEKNGWNMNWKSYGNTLQTISTGKALKRPTFTQSKNLSSI